MLPAKIRRFKTEALLRILLMFLCVGLVLAIPSRHKTASTAIDTIPQDTKVQFAATVTSPNPKEGEAQQALARGEVLGANWTAVSLRQAIDQYEKAALLWKSTSDFRKALEATLRAGDLYFYLSEFAQALKKYQNAEALAQKSGDWLGQATALSQMGRLQSYLGHNDLAQKQLRQAFDLFERHERNRTVKAANAYGEALTNLAELSYSKGDFLNASKQLDNALNVFQDDRKGEARVRLFKGYIAGTIGETKKALEEISRALELYREINNKSGEGLALTAKGMWHSSYNHDEVHAVEMHKAALETFHIIGDRYSEAIALNAIGQAYDYLGGYSNALSYYKNALTLFENVGMLYAASGTTCNIASAEYRSEKLDQALASYERCLQLSHNVGNRRFEAFAREGIAGIYGAQGRHESALKQFKNLEGFFESINDHRGQAMALNAHGGLFLQLGEKQKALDIFGQAFSLSEKMGDKEILIATLYNLARANEAVGLHEIALSLIKKSFNLIEEIRANVASPDFRASYFSAVRRHYDLCIEILMQLHRQRPGEGFAAEAFSVSEQSRARLLLDLLSESRSEIRAGAARDLVEKERSLRGLLRAQAEYQLNLSLGGRNSTELAEVADQIARLRSDYQSVQAQLRKQNPRLFSYEQFAPADLERIQKELRGSDTMLLEYALGDDHSYLWAVTSDSSDSFILPARKDIEDAASEFYKTITARQGSDGQSEKDYQVNIAAADKVYFEKASNLSRMLLGPVAEKLGSRRLVIVTDGALQYIPFEALPPRFEQTTGPVEAPTSFLISTNEVVMLPSASTLIAIRGARSNKGSPGKLVAIIADPVFSSSDDRVQREAPPSESAKVATDQNLDQAEQQTIKNLRLARLTHASEEADAISAVAPWGSTLVARGFDASRETAMSSEVSKAQIVHFATHGFLDSTHPELSGIVLTMMDRNGAQTKGIMPLPDIYSLDLSAELTVLSACQTALGKETKGEGLVGLTHSFMSAGAKSVVASLWKVDDRATAALMTHFYKGMLEQGMTPAAALRSAKLKMMTEKQWRAPYYWAGFVLQGEYTNHIAVDRYSKLRLGLGLLFLVILIAVALLVFQKRRRRIPPARFT
jgi:CHAT domain-containing protein/tetratricopeptide (TPR) repeat protein